MKTFKLIICTFCLFIQIPQIIAKEHHSLSWKDKFEKLWVEKGINQYIKNLNDTRTLEEKDILVFISLNKERLKNDHNYFFKNAFSGDTSNENYSSLKKILLNNIDIYNKNVQELLIQKKQKTESYMGALKEISEYNSKKTKDTSLTNTLTSPPPLLCGPDIGFESGFGTWEAYLGYTCGFGCNSGLLLTSYTDASSFDRVVLETSGVDPNAAGLPKLCPTGGGASLRIENYLNGGNMSKVSYTFHVNSTFYVIKYAVVLEDPGKDHPKSDKPFFQITAFDQMNNEIECARYEVFASEGDLEFADQFISVSGTSIKYKYWTDKILPLQDYMGQDITVNFTVSDCAWGGHIGYAYIDGECLNENIIIGSCIDDVSILTAPNIDLDYIWKGPGIVTSNNQREITVNKPGDYLLRMKGVGTCEYKQVVTIPPCADEKVNCNGLNIDIDNSEISDCESSTNSYNINFDVDITGFANTGVLRIVDGKLEKYYNPPLTPSMNLSMFNLIPDGKPHRVYVYYYPDHFITNGNYICCDSFDYTAPTSCYDPLPFETPCENCITGFSPLPGEKYIISAWLKNGSPGVNPENTAPTNGKINITFGGSATTFMNIASSGNLIEGWQRLYFEFLVPSDADDIKIELASSSSIVYFDDIRIHPVNAMQKSYVYDPVSLKLVAELDENNYATLYEYDKEGKLIRQKKETEKGVVTISENRQSNPKHD